MAQKNHFTVVRNQGYQGSEFKTRCRHNERKNEVYGNGDIEKSREPLNIHFRESLRPDGTPETYEETYKRLLAEKKIVEKWLKPDSKLFAELVFDVNTEYFEESGGYDYAKTFFEEAYRLAVKEVGSEDYILSAVFHADERNKALSEKLGHDVYHYHLHVVYVPIVIKEERWSTRCKDPALIGTVKEVIPQISHAKKWPIKVPVERNGKTYTVNSYSLLQDRYFEHMRAAGFLGFERGERGSSAEHLDVLDFKIKQDTARADEAEALADAKEKEAAVLDEKVEKKKARLDKLDEQVTVKEKAKATIAEVEAMGKPVIIGSGFTVTGDELKKLKTLAKKSVTADKQVAESKNKLEAVKMQMAGLQSELSAMTQERNHWKKKFNDLDRMVKPFISAIINFPQVLLTFIDEHWQERRERQRQKPHNQEAR